MGFSLGAVPDNIIMTELGRVIVGPLITSSKFKFSSDMFMIPFKLI